MVGVGRRQGLARPPRARRAPGWARRPRPGPGTPVAGGWRHLYEARRGHGPSHNVQRSQSLCCRFLAEAQASPAPAKGAPGEGVAVMRPNEEAQMSIIR